MPVTAYIPLLALLGRRLTEDEVAVVVDELVRTEGPNFDTADAGVAITRITDALPSLADLERVQRRFVEAVGKPANWDD